MEIQEIPSKHQKKDTFTVKMVHLEQVAPVKLDGVYGVSILEILKTQLDTTLNSLLCLSLL